ncbi:uncharacterized protein EV420DRAFT_1747957 [Desarmillaria tabescens]|uniref:PH domain-containing protein n=1 Tax=Armillaria tabescens TaxID=1929756 RepID=A0AA39KC37_ARMTA|nr:uncharacterized protein EV420DRAFT_1747957 [Desarmillaria tabescens]KAK0458421.1 hypothetical protein EV420DRAFT_1747957 [Desarmillaria tabescens]
MSFFSSFPPPSNDDFNEFMMCPALNYCRHPCATDSANVGTCPENDGVDEYVREKYMPMVKGGVRTGGTYEKLGIKTTVESRGYFEELELLRGQRWSMEGCAGIILIHLIWMIRLAVDALIRTVRQETGILLRNDGSSSRKQASLRKMAEWRVTREAAAPEITTSTDVSNESKLCLRGIFARDDVSSSGEQGLEYGGTGRKITSEGGSVHMRAQRLGFVYLVLGEDSNRTKARLGFSNECVADLKQKAGSTETAGTGGSRGCARGGAKAEIRRVKEEQGRMEEQEERDRRARIERDMRMSTEARRRKKEAEERVEEEKKRELAERRVREREKRLEEHRRLEQWRAEQARIKEEELKREEAERARERTERNKRVEQMAARVKRDKTESMLTGWATIQINDSLVWRRRYYKFIGDTMFFYRSPKDMNQVLDQIQLRGKLNGLKEWDDGYEELKAIPNSFAIEFKDQRGPCAMFCDTEEEKDKLLGVLHYTAGL